MTQGAAGTLFFSPSFWLHQEILLTEMKYLIAKVCHFPFFFSLSSHLSVLSLRFERPICHSRVQRSCFACEGLSVPRASAGKEQAFFDASAPKEFGVCLFAVKSCSHTFAQKKDAFEGQAAGKCGTSAAYLRSQASHNSNYEGHHLK